MGNHSCEYRIALQRNSSRNMSQLGQARCYQICKQSHCVTSCRFLHSCYPWHAEGLSEWNHIILHQMHIILRILKLVISCAGDLNRLYSDPFESGQTTTFDAKLTHPGCNSTSSTTKGRVVDYGLIFESMSQAVAPMCNVAWGPMYVCSVNLFQNLNLSLPQFRFSHNHCLRASSTSSRKTLAFMTSI